MSRYLICTVQGSGKCLINLSLSLAFTLFIKLQFSFFSFPECLMSAGDTGMTASLRQWEREAYFGGLTSIKRLHLMHARRIFESCVFARL